jgi:hypothetical protein
MAGAKIFLTGSVRLNAQSWDAAVRTFAVAAPAGSLADREIDIDLRDTGFADFVTLGHLLVFIDLLVSARARVVLRLPRTDFVDGIDTAAARRQRQRQTCRLFLKQSGFTTAIDTAGWPAASVEVGSEDTGGVVDPASELVDPLQVEDPRPPRKLRRVLPYLWVRGPASGERAPAFETALREIGLARETASAVARGVLDELVGDVGGGADRKVLVGGCVVAKESYRPQMADLHPGLHELARWAAGLGSPLARIFVGGASGSRQLDAVLRHTAQQAEASRPWRAAQIVRGYQGAIVASSRGQTRGIVFGGETPLKPITALPSGVDVGTAVDCMLLVAPADDAILSDHELVTPARTSLPGSADLTCVTSTAGPSGELRADDLREVEALLTTASAESVPGVVLAVHIDPVVGQGHHEIVGVLRQVLAVALRANSSAPLVLALPGINRRLLSVAVDDLLAEPSDTPPVLVVCSRTRHYWIGGDPDERFLLGALSVAAEPVLLDELATRGFRSTSRLVARRLRERSTLVDFVSGTTRLGVSPHAAINALIAHLSVRIKDSVEFGTGPGVTAGTFLTPALRVVTRLCDTRVLLGHLGGEQLAGFALACKVEIVTRGATAPRPPVVLRVGNVPDEFAAVFAQTLTGTERLVSRSDLRRMHADDELRAAQVVVVTGMVSTEDDIGAELDDLAAYGVVPVAVAAVVDTRRTRPSGTFAAEVVVTSTRLPLISLAAADIEPRRAARDAVVVVNPLLERPDPEVAPTLVPLTEQRTYIAALKRARAARLAHIARPAGRHYTAYVDPTLLFREQDWRQLFLDIAIDKIRSAHRDVAGRSRIARLCVVYPSDTTDDIAEVARGLTAALDSAGLADRAEAVAIPRAALGTHWLFPALVSLPDAEHVVLLDSSTGTGRTIQQMLRVAAAPGVRMITGIILLNGLEDLDALALQQVATIAPLTASGPRHTERIPVGLHFVARSAVSSLDARECDVCGLRRGYEDMSRVGPLPKRLRFQRQWLMDNLAAQSKHSAFAEEATDITGMHIGQDDCVNYLRWKFDLRDAATSTARRRSVVERIKRAHHRPNVSDALVRLLFAEMSWLRAAPLNLIDVRPDVARLATRLVLGDSAMSVDPSLRVQALILLATVEPIRFVGSYAGLLHANRDHWLVTGQILLEGLKLIVTPDPPMGTSRDALVQSFTKQLTDIETSLANPADQRAHDLGVDVSDIRYLLSHTTRLLVPPPTDKQSAWSALRDYRSAVDTHTYENYMFFVQATLHYLDEGPPPDDKSAMSFWTTCSKMLVADVLPNLAPLRQWLLSYWVRTSVGRADSERWERVVHGHGRAWIDDITARLAAILVDTTRSTSQAAVNEVVDDLRWWDGHFLTAQVEPGAGSAGAALIEIIKRCPIDVADAVGAAFRGVRARTSTDAGVPDWRAFCPSDVLHEALIHIRRNAESYHRAPGTEQVFEIDIRSADDGRRITIAIRNTGSSATGRGGGRGLATLRDKLDFFGGRITVVESPAAPWTYEVALSVERWRMP